MSSMFPVLLAVIPLLGASTDGGRAAVLRGQAQGNDKLYLQYLSSLTEDKGNDFSLTLATALTRYREGSLGNLGWTVDELFRLDIPFGLLNRALSLSFKSLWDLGEDAAIIRAFNEHRRHKVFQILNEDGLQALARSLEKNGDQSGAEELWERMIQNFPISPESRWAMQKLQKLSCRAGARPPVRLSLMRRLSRNTTVDPGLADWLLAQLDYPVVPPDGGPAVILNDIEKLEAMRYIRLYADAVQRAELMLADRPNTEDSIRILTVLGEAHSALGDHLKALPYYARADFLAKGHDQQLRESYAATLVKTGNFGLSARYYESLRTRHRGMKFDWQIFWSYYRAGNHESSFSRLKNMPINGKRDPFLRDARLYWQGRLLKNLGRNDEARGFWKKVEDSSQTIFYRILANRALEKDANPKPVQTSIPLRNAIIRYNSIVNTVNEFSKNVGIDPSLVLSIVNSESHFLDEAQSEVGARGLMQIMPYTAVRVAKLMNDNNFSLARLAEPETNIRYGTYYLKLLLDFYEGNSGLAVAAYNAGPWAVNTWLKACSSCNLDEFIETISYSETKKYVREVLGNYSRFRGLDNAASALALHPELPLMLKDLSTIF